MRYRADLGIDDCWKYIDLFWIVFVFILFRIFFEFLWNWFSDNNNNNILLNQNSGFINNNNNNTFIRSNLNTNANLNNNIFTNNNNFNSNNWVNWLDWFRWHRLVFSILAEAFIGFLIALLYLWWQQYTDTDRSTELCVGQENHLQNGYIRNALALLVTSFLLLILQWYFITYSPTNRRRIIIRNRVIDNFNLEY